MNYHWTSAITGKGGNKMTFKKGNLWSPSESFQRRQWQSTSVLLPGKSHGWRSLVGCSPWGHCELDTTEQLHFQFSLSCVREGNGNPFQCSCLENPRDGGAWWAAIYGVTQSWTRLKWLSSSSSSSSESFALGNVDFNIMHSNISSMQVGPHST